MKYEWWWLRYLNGVRQVDHMLFMVAHIAQTSIFAWPGMGPTNKYAPPLDCGGSFFISMPAQLSQPQYMIEIPIWPTSSGKHRERKEQT
jgi:hypothetical protein